MRGLFGRVVLAVVRHPLLRTICDLGWIWVDMSRWGCDLGGFGRYGCALLLMTYDFAGFGLIVSG